ncbi:hypothetical protein PTSG_04644 [Salpingoeca rosetta]|uniref:Uncharacterized protein n=1 Tax=Salpingoeca rosetta (strain ATCC 50818 / BSB-021) TaxID=946362 RepID=F2U808_SALR5|nr:uncharacterized protein PTSG_04644 [Salpingoeca rosetta]EGD72913.1 hypothetical protein PTSG_04644 [Salpingoeca rosetta]|eukprot:XP_004994735.1 hypothetical protein PTSG_04644 [Salpingoeca rosetta]
MPERAEFTHSGYEQITEIMEEEEVYREPVTVMQLLADEEIYEAERSFACANMALVASYRPMALVELFRALSNTNDEGKELVQALYDHTVNLEDFYAHMVGIIRYGEDEACRQHAAILVVLSERIREDAPQRHAQ